MNRIIISSLFFASLALAGDSTGHVIDHFRYSVKSYNHLNTTVEYGLGDLTVKAGTSRNTISGLLSYDPSRKNPQLSFTPRGNQVDFAIKFEDADSFDYKTDLNFSDYRKLKFKENVSEIDLALPMGIAMDLSLEFGFGNAHIDLSTLQIERMNIECGLSDVNMEIQSPNPVKAQKLKIESGLGDLSIVGLGNLRAADIDLDVGLGSTDIDFRGDRLADTDFNIEVGLGDLDLIMPRHANIKIRVSDSFLSSLSITGLVEEKEDLWVTPNWKPGLPVLNLDVSVGLGSVNIFVRE